MCACAQEVFFECGIKTIQEGPRDLILLQLWAVLGVKWLENCFGHIIANITPQLAKEQLTWFWLNIYANNLCLEEWMHVSRDHRLLFSLVLYVLLKGFCIVYEVKDWDTHKVWAEVIEADGNTLVIYTELWIILYCMKPPSMWKAPPLRTNYYWKKLWRVREVYISGIGHAAVSKQTLGKVCGEWLKFQKIGNGQR